MPPEPTYSKAIIPESLACSYRVLLRYNIIYITSRHVESNITMSNKIIFDVSFGEGTNA